LIFGPRLRPDPKIFARFGDTNTTHAAKIRGVCSFPGCRRCGGFLWREQCTTKHAPRVIAACVLFRAVAAAAAPSGVNNAQQSTRREKSRRVFIFEGEARAWHVRVDSPNGCHYF